MTPVFFVLPPPHKPDKRISQALARTIENPPGSLESSSICLNRGFCGSVQFAGRWYRVGLAYDSAHFVPYRDKLKASMGVVTVLPNGNVNLSMWDAT